ncbi:hypothetical protein C2G38_2156209 [Gigaspora rosea]|uniref:MD-2-related lipid-recognition domain-containing protein n=1 Tax=Gigaspora rosea TaxID=44941 RepID=A0A397W302_9GLOM|nr:hypothetical protein C2G38_2156209 [Gigaspora rosea]
MLYMANANDPFIPCEDGTLMNSVFWDPDPLGGPGSSVSFNILQRFDNPTAEATLEFAFLDANSKHTSGVTYNLIPNTTNINFTYPMLVPQFLPPQYIVQVQVVEAEGIGDPVVLCCVRFPRFG